MATAPSGMKGFYTLLAGLAVAGAALLGYLVLKPPAVSIPVNVNVTAADTEGFHGYLLGASTAPVEVTEYADYQCPACQAYATVEMPTIEERLIHTGRVRWRYRDFPLDQLHPHARVAQHAAACADEQGKFWEANRMIYQGQPEWSGKRDASGTFRDYMQKLGLDIGRYDACMKSGKYAGRIQASLNEGNAVGVQSTPSFVVAGHIYAGNRALNYDALRHLADSLSPPAAQ